MGNKTMNWKSRSGNRSGWMKVREKSEVIMLAIEVFVTASQIMSPVPQW